MTDKEAHDNCNLDNLQVKTAQTSKSMVCRLFRYLVPTIYLHFLTALVCSKRTAIRRSFSLA